MSKKGLLNDGETSAEVFHPQDSFRKTNGIPPMPPKLDPDAAREWRRLVAERQAQPDGILLEDGVLIEIAATAFSYRVKIERLVRRLGLTFRPEYASNDWKKPYLVACHALRCTPAIPIPKDEP